MLNTTKIQRIQSTKNALDWLEGEVDLSSWLG